MNGEQRQPVKGMLMTIDGEKGVWTVRDSLLGYGKAFLAQRGVHVEIIRGEDGVWRTGAMRVATFLTDGSPCEGDSATVEGSDLVRKVTWVGNNGDCWIWHESAGSTFVSRKSDGWHVAAGGARVTFTPPVSPTTTLSPECGDTALIEYTGDSPYIRSGAWKVESVNQSKGKVVLFRPAEEPLALATAVRITIMPYHTPGGWAVYYGPFTLAEPLASVTFTREEKLEALRKKFGISSEEPKPYRQPQLGDRADVENSGRVWIVRGLTLTFDGTYGAVLEVAPSRRQESQSAATLLVQRGEDDIYRYLGRDVATFTDPATLPIDTGKLEEWERSPALHQPQIGDYVTRLVDGARELWRVDDSDASGDHLLCQRVSGPGVVNEINCDEDGLWFWADGQPALFTSSDQTDLAWASTRLTELHALLRQEYFTAYKTATDTAEAWSGETRTYARTQLDLLERLLFQVEAGIEFNTAGLTGIDLVDMCRKWDDFQDALTGEARGYLLEEED